MKDLFDLPASRQARDWALETVAARNAMWMASSLAKIQELPQGWTGTGEDIRRKIEDAPAHHNAWGALIRTAQLRCYIVKTGRWLPMKSKTSHARMTPEYRKLQ